MGHLCTCVTVKSSTELSTVDTTIINCYMVYYWSTGYWLHFQTRWTGVYDIGGCQDSILVRTGMLLCAYFCVLHWTCFNIGTFLFLVNISELDTLCSNHDECFSLASACLANFVICMALLFFRLCIFAIFSAFPKDTYFS